MKTLSRKTPYLLGLFAAASLSCGGPASGVLAVNTRNAAGGAVEMWVTMDEEPMPLHEADGKLFLLGVEGRRYQVHVANGSDGRVEAVLSVDGRDVISGREADFRVDRGYVLEPGEELEVEGFRKSFDAVAAFEFSAPGDSYAARMGDGSNAGVIGLAVFEERERADSAPMPIAADDRDADRRYDREGERAGGAAKASLAPASAAPMEEAESQGLGTRYGEEIGSRAQIVPFQRADREAPSEILVVYYDDRAGLEARGIVLPPDEHTPPDPCQGPNPFPGVDCNLRFAPAPKPLEQ